MGDCNGDGTVAVNELITGVGIALDTQPASACRAFPVDADGRLGINELVLGVNNALDGCGGMPTPTPMGAQFVDNGDGTITDRHTKLVWEKQNSPIYDENRVYVWSWGQCSDDSTTYCQRNAVTAATCRAGAGAGSPGCAECAGSATCEPPVGIATIWDRMNELNAAGFAGRHDWRVPTIMELTTINACTSPIFCLPEAFNDTYCFPGCDVVVCSCTQPGCYWSATTDPDFPGGALGVDFESGEVRGTDKDNIYGFGLPVRAVRGGH